MLVYLIVGVTSALFVMFIAYYCILWVLARREKSSDLDDDETGLPEITVIIPCHSKCPGLEEKVNETLALYPSSKIQVIVVWSQPSEDSSVSIERLRKTPVELVLEDVRSGKASALSIALSRARGEIIVITDVDTQLSEKSITSLVRHFALPAVGAVSGRLYFKYREVEDFLSHILFNKLPRQLKDYEAAVDSCSFAPGELLAFRRSLIPQIPADSLCDDLYICWKVRSLGSRCASESEAVAYEKPPRSLMGNVTKTRRIVTGTLVELGRFKSMLFRRRYGLFGSFILPFYVLRVAVAPILVLSLLVSLALYLTSVLGSSIVASLVVAGIVFIIGVLPQLRRRIKGTVNSATGYFLGTILGLLDYALGRRSPVWKPAK